MPFPGGLFPFFLLKIWTHTSSLSLHRISWLLTLHQKALAQVWVLSHIYHFSLLIQVGLGIEKTESRLMLKLSFNTVAVRLGILANPCPSVFGAKISVLISCVFSQIGRMKTIHKSFPSVVFFLINGSKCIQVGFLKFVIRLLVFKVIEITKSFKLTKKLE